MRLELHYLLSLYTVRDEHKYADASTTVVILLLCYTVEPRALYYKHPQDHQNVNCPELIREVHVLSNYLIFQS